MSTLVGDSTNTGSYASSNSEVGQLDASTFTASASGTATTAWVYTGNDITGAYVLVFNSTTNALIAQTASFVPVSGWNQVPLQASLSIVSGTGYVMGIYYKASSTSFGTVGLGGALNTKYQNTSSFVVPTTWAPGGTQAAAGGKNVSVYLTGNSASGQKGGMFFAESFRPKIPAVAAAMFMPLSWSINRRNKRAPERRKR